MKGVHASSGPASKPPQISRDLQATSTVPRKSLASAGETAFLGASDACAIRTAGTAGETARGHPGKCKREFGSVAAKEFHLIESKLKPGGAEYTTLETFPFIVTEV